jgi:hypothetical protein
MNPIVRAMRAKVARRDNWAQIRVGVCALLLPPLALGAAFYSMLAAPDEGAARPPATATKPGVVRPELLRDTTPARAVGRDLQSAARATQSIATPDQPAPERGVSASAPDTRRQASSGPEDMARAQSDPDQLTGTPLGKLDGSPPGSRLPEPSWPAPAEASTALLPRGLVPPGKASSQVPPPRMTVRTTAAHAPSAAAVPSGEGPVASAPTARKHARSETAATRRSAQPSEPAFSLKDWLQQLGIVPPSTRG